MDTTVSTELEYTAFILYFDTTWLVDIVATMKVITLTN